MSEQIERRTFVHLKVAIDEQFKVYFATWQAKLNSVIVNQEGFISLEFIQEGKEWSVVQCFHSRQDALNWKSSLVYSDLINDLKEGAACQKVEEKIKQGCDFKGGITEVIIAEISRENRETYREWIAKVHLAEAKFTGFRGMYMQSPDQTKGKFWITLLQFDNEENLDKWLISSERMKLIEEIQPLILSLETHRIITPYAGWFASIAKGGKIPPVWKETMTILLVLFPIVMLEFKYLMPLLQNFNVSLRTFIGNALSVCLISFPFMPVVIRLLRWWLNPQGPYFRIFNIGGTAFVFALYLLEIWLFWSYV